MNLDDALSAHIKWKFRLGKFIDGISEEALNHRTVCKDNLCTLGQWIHGEGAKFKGLREYRQLLNKHANLHVLAAELVKRVEKGEKAGAKAMLAGPFAKVSNETVVAIVELKQAVELLEAPQAEISTPTPVELAPPPRFLRADLSNNSSAG